MLAESLLDRMFDMPQFAVLLGCLIPIAAILGGLWYKAQRAKSDNELKRSLVDRGLSVTEIERIMAAGRKDDDE